MHSIYNKEREARLRASLWGDGDERYDDADYLDGGSSSVVSTSGSDVRESVGAVLKKKIQKVICACYPWLHAGNEGASNLNFFFYINLLAFLYR